MPVAALNTERPLRLAANRWMRVVLSDVREDCFAATRRRLLRDRKDSFLAHAPYRVTLGNRHEDVVEVGAQTGRLACLASQCVHGHAPNTRDRVTGGLGHLRDHVLVSEMVQHAETLEAHARIWMAKCIDDGARRRRLPGIAQRFELVLPEQPGRPLEHGFPGIDDSLELRPVCEPVARGELPLRFMKRLTCGALELARLPSQVPKAWVVR